MSGPRSPAPRPGKILFLNRSYWPDAEATGQLLTELCEDLAPSFDVTVLAGQPNQNPAGASFRRSGWETHNGVTIRRVWHTRFRKSRLLGRVVNLITYLVAALVAALRVRRPDIIVVETDPPLLCLLGDLLRRWRRAKLVVYLQDIYPDIAVALGKVRDGRLVRWLRRRMIAVYRRADRVVVLSRDMRDLLVVAGVPAERIACIPNWVDTDQIVPRQEENAFRRRHGLNGHFVVMYSGNLGLCQRLEDALAAADRLRDQREIFFLFVGDGASRRRLEETARKMELSNVRFLPYQPKDELADSLSAADLHLVPLDPRIASCLMPSKLYGVLASGSPVLAVAPDYCELAEVTREEGIGLVVAPDRPAALAEAIQWAAAHREELQDMGIQARKLAEQQYDRRLSTARFAVLLGEVSGVPAVAADLPAAPAAEEPASQPASS